MIGANIANGPVKFILNYTTCFSFLVWKYFPIYIYIYIIGSTKERDDWHIVHVDWWPNIPRTTNTFVLGLGLSNYWTHQYQVWRHIMALDIDSRILQPYPPDTLPISYGRPNFWLYGQNKEHPSLVEIPSFAIDHFTWQ